MLYASGRCTAGYGLSAVLSSWKGPLVCSSSAAIAGIQSRMKRPAAIVNCEHVRMLSEDCSEVERLAAIRAWLTEVASDADLVLGDVTEFMGELPSIAIFAGQSPVIVKLPDHATIPLASLLLAATSSKPVDLPILGACHDVEYMVPPRILAQSLYPPVAIHLEAVETSLDLYPLTSHSCLRSINLYTALASGAQRGTFTLTVYGPHCMGLRNDALVKNVIQWLQVGWSTYEQLAAGALVVFSALFLALGDV